MSEKIYLEEIDAFYDWSMTNTPSTGEIALWHALMSIWRKASYIDEFSVANLVLQSRTGLSRQGVEKARNGLIQKSIIMYSKGKGRKAGKYQLIPLNEFVCKIIGTTVARKDTQQWHNSRHMLSTLFSSNLVPCFCYEDIEEVALSFERQIMPITDRSGEIDLAIYDQLSSWLTDMPKDIVLKAIEIAFIQNGRSISYISKILHNWKMDGVNTLEKLDAYIAAYENKKSKPKVSQKVVPMSTARQSSNRFHNFEQRTDKYSKDELEKILGMK